MFSAEFSVKRSLIIRVKHNSELVRFITEFAENRGIAAATLTVIGAIKHGKLGSYDQEKHVYKHIEIETPHEMVCCMGNISLKNGKPFLHAHAVFSDENGNTKAGHLVEAVVFAAEVQMYELDGPKLERKHDKITDLSLWRD